jgi:subtilisin-like proprotein convertase family protein
MPSGIDNMIAVPSGTTIADLNVQLDINHTYVGDLVVTLKHVDTGTTVTLINRPGTTPALPAGCDGSDISCTLDDQAGRVAQNECRSTAPAIDGSVKPTDALAAFTGQAAGGTWRLNVSDNAPDDVGSLFGWCLIVNSAAPVVTAYTCEGAEECTLNIGDSFTQSFSFTAPRGATSWRITAVRDDGMPSDIGSGGIAPPSTGGTIPLMFNPFTCVQGPCRTTEYDYFLVVTDALGADSPRARVHIVVLGNA